jgi:starvation-inducible DNA-binding protein
MPVTHRTKNDLPKATRDKVTALLNARLADAADFTMASKQAHWNIKGPQFMQLHKLFDDVYSMASAQVDQIAERVVQLGGTADGTLQSAAKNTSLKPYPTKLVGGRDHVEALSTMMAAFGKFVRDGIALTAEWGDADTSDMLTEISRDLDKQLWFVEAHLEGGR